jgi:hypothetical protein
MAALPAAAQGEADVDAAGSVGGSGLAAVGTGDSVDGGRHSTVSSTTRCRAVRRYSPGWSHEVRVSSTRTLSPMTSGSA